jgi:hypothetical protein
MGLLVLNVSGTVVVPKNLAAARLASRLDWQQEMRVDLAKGMRRGISAALAWSANTSAFE